MTNNEQTARGVGEEWGGGGLELLVIWCHSHYGSPAARKHYRFAETQEQRERDRLVVHGERVGQVPSSGRNLNILELYYALPFLFLNKNESVDKI